MNRFIKKFVFLYFYFIPLLVFGDTFKDIDNDHWAYDAVKELSEKEIIKGFKKGKDKIFDGEKSVTRYELAAALAETLKYLNEEEKRKKNRPINVDRLLEKSDLNEEDLKLFKMLLEEFKKEINEMDLKIMNLEKAIEEEKEKKKKFKPGASFYISIGALILSIISVSVAASKK